MGSPALDGHRRRRGRRDRVHLHRLSGLATPLARASPTDQAAGGGTQSHGGGGHSRAGAEKERVSEAGRRTAQGRARHRYESKRTHGTSFQRSHTIAAGAQRPASGGAGHGPTSQG